MPLRPVTPESLLVVLTDAIGVVSSARALLKKTDSELFLIESALAGLRISRLGSTSDLYRDRDGDIWRGNDLTVSLISVQDSANAGLVGDHHYTDIPFSQADSEFGLEKLED